MAKNIPVTEVSKNTQAQELLDVIMSYARLDFNKTCSLKEDGSTLDAIASGVNMLGEELQSSTISAREKEHLLSEIHHRVKNNMQIISSMLRLHKNMINDPKLDPVFEDCQSRITAMSLIHEMLYASSDFKYTSLKEYTIKLVETIEISYTTKDSKITFDIDVPPVLKLDIDQIIPLGLILNECISNTYKHAFPNKIGHFYMQVQPSKGSLVIRFGDNGIGMTENVECENQTLGLQLIELLSEQINATFETNNKDGLHYVFTINNEPI